MGSHQSEEDAWRKEGQEGVQKLWRLHRLSAVVDNPKSFVQYLQEGLQLHFNVAIDFTGSNGNPTQPTSLHYINPYQPNEYISAIQSVGGVIRDYDTDKLFPALGYGAKLQDGSVSHAFALNGNEANPFCQGIEGLVGAYKQAIGNVTLWGPTNFSPIIQKVAGFAAEQHAGAAGAAYYVLLIITDGVITDLAKTKNEIVKASHLPLSIIIIGVGSADFSNMTALDGDDPNFLKDSRGNVAERDIVQFVPFRQFSSSPQLLAKEVLAEIPGQVCEYMKKHAK